MDEPAEPLSEEEQQLLSKYYESYGLGSGYPKAEEKTGMFQLFNKIIDTKDSSKVANFSKEDLHNVRLFQNIGGYAELMGWEQVAQHFKDDAEIIAATSLGFRAKLIETIITQRRKSETKVGSAKSKTWFKKEDDV